MSDGEENDTVLKSSRLERAQACRKEQLNTGHPADRLGVREKGRLTITTSISSGILKVHRGHVQTGSGGRVLGKSSCKKCLRIGKWGTIPAW